MEERKEYYGHDIQFSTDLKMIALINGGGINIYASEDGSSIQSIPVQTHEESKVLFHPSGKMITHMNLNTLSAFKLPSAELMWEIEVSGGCGYDIWEFSHNGELFGMSNLDQASKICKSDTGEKIGLLKKGNDERVNEIHFSKDDKKIITCSYDKAIRIWDVDRSELIHKMDAAHESMDSVVTTDDFLTGVSFSSWDNTFYLWDLENGELMDKISMDFSVEDFKLISSQSKPHKLIVVGMNDYKRDSSINAVNKKPIAIQICSILF